MNSIQDTRTEVNKVASGIRDVLLEAKLICSYASDNFSFIGKKGICIQNGVTFAATGSVFTKAGADAVDNIPDKSSFAFWQACLFLSK
jgi:hypothetical protein